MAVSQGHFGKACWCEMTSRKLLGCKSQEFDSNFTGCFNCYIMLHGKKAAKQVVQLRLATNSFRRNGAEWEFHHSFLNLLIIQDIIFLVCRYRGDPSGKCGMVYLVCLLRKLNTSEFRGSIVGRSLRKASRKPTQVSGESYV